MHVFHVGCFSEEQFKGTHGGQEGTSTPVLQVVCQHTNSANGAGGGWYADMPISSFK